MAISPERLQAAIESLRTRPGHENVRGLVRELCVVGLGVSDHEVNFEVSVPEVRGRMDALMGATIFEFKRDLRREKEDAETQLTKYLETRERDTRRRYLGIATDGAEFVAYELRDGHLTRYDGYVPSTKDPRGLLQWLDSALAVREDLQPDPDTIRAELGRDSLVFQRALAELRGLWDVTKHISEAELKRDLWHRHLEFVYGTLVEPDELFLQHTYLTIVAKTMAVRALVADPVSPTEILAGTPFVQVGLNGAVETDFFDWVRLADGGLDLVARIASQISRFRLTEIDADVLKALYESLIDPAQRHYLGEYYTPDWLAERVCREAIPNPLETRVLDPACGSGTFLFHAVRQLLDAAESARMPLDEALKTCEEKIAGIDVHPVAVLFARVTYLLAIGTKRLQQRQDVLYVPIYLGDSLQWNVRQLIAEEEVEIAVPGEPPLRFPGAVAGDPNLLERVLGAMRQLADEGASKRAIQAWLNANTTLPESDRKILTESYEHMRALHQAGRDHIWTYVVRNLTRPLWLSHRKGKPDVVIGNPPWLRFNAMSRQLQERFRRESSERGLWVGGKVATHQDLSAYFFVRSVERYLDLEGRIAFVMPLASLTRAQYAGFRRCEYADRAGNVMCSIQFDNVWTFDSDVAPLFPVPSAVLFAHRTMSARLLPATVLAFHGQLPHRDASFLQARQTLKVSEESWPESVLLKGGSAYRTRFKQGATIVPRRLIVVVPSKAGRFGVNPKVPLVESRIGANDKRPWKEVKPLQGQVEKGFLRPLLLGESIAPFRLIRPAMAVIPWDSKRKTLFTSKAALNEGHIHLAQWLKKAETLWEKHRSSQMTLKEQMDYYGKLSAQFPIKRLRVAYAGSGTKPAAAIIRDDRAVIEHGLYWMEAETMQEAEYIVAILNSEAVRLRIEKLQAQGQFGARHFDKIMFSLPIPSFSSKVVLHREIAKAGLKAEKLAAMVSLNQNQGFQSARSTIREALSEAGISEAIDTLVNQLLDKQGALAA